ncbi:MAG: hypothetical protein ACT6RN_14150 [Agrobacterium sp.]|uniref:hypothetical protein n=1 Tax=Agrobacterium sp. TaxID=361 RepID=UPI004033E99A
MRGLWQRVTYYRHLSEFWSLNKAQRTPFMAVFPIWAVVSFWWFMMAMPFVLPYILLQSYSDDIAKVFLLIAGLPILLVVVLAAQWVFGWYWIAAMLVNGRPEAARKKQQALMDAIDAYRARLF